MTKADETTMALFRARLGYAQTLRERGDRCGAELMEAFAYELLEQLSDAA